LRSARLRLRLAVRRAGRIAITLISILQLAWVARRETSTVVVVGRWAPR
jgi:hypothetical protein